VRWFACLSTALALNPDLVTISGRSGFSMLHFFASSNQLESFVFERFGLLPPVPFPAPSQEQQKQFQTQQLEQKEQPTAATTALFEKPPSHVYVPPPVHVYTYQWKDSGLVVDIADSPSSSTMFAYTGYDLTPTGAPQFDLVVPEGQPQQPIALRTVPLMEMLQLAAQRNVGLVWNPSPSSSSPSAQVTWDATRVRQLFELMHYLQVVNEQQQQQAMLQLQEQVQQQQQQQAAKKH